MRKGDSKGDKGLRQVVRIRITEKKYKELQAIVDQTKDETVSGAVRKILMNRPIRVLVHDHTTDLLLDDLAALRSEIKAIGVNINQITRYFNTYPEDAKKRFYAKIGLQQHLAMEAKIDHLTAMISELCAKWLSESKQAKGYKGH